jgi:hypothetical protein
MLKTGKTLKKLGASCTVGKKSEKFLSYKNKSRKTWRIPSGKVKQNIRLWLKIHLMELQLSEITKFFLQMTLFENAKLHKR